MCSITKEEALKMFEKYLTTHDPCVWAKHNAPFMCTKQGPPAPSAVFQGRSPSAPTDRMYGCSDVQMFEPVRE